MSYVFLFLLFTIILACHQPVLRVHSRPYDTSTSRILRQVAHGRHHLHLHLGGLPRSRIDGNRLIFADQPLRADFPVAPSGA